MSRPWFDLHSHLVPGVDDGPVTPAESLRILEKMRRQMPEGSLVVATPHYSTSMSLFALRSRMEKSCRFAERVSCPELRVVCAGELKLGMRYSGFHQLLAYPGTRRVLVEFTHGLIWFGALRRCMRLIKGGYRPVLAHAERYRWAGASRLRILSGFGAGVSMSLRSLAVSRFRKRAEWIIESGSCHLVTSDCHEADDPVLGQAARELVERLRPGSWESLAVENPRRVLEDEPLPPLAGGQGHG